MNPEVELVILKGWPRGMTIKTAAAYCGVSVPSMHKLINDNPNIFRTLNWGENGVTFVDKEDCDRLFEERKRIGVQRLEKTG